MSHVIASSHLITSLNNIENMEILHRMEILHNMEILDTIVDNLQSSPSYEITYYDAYKHHIYSISLAFSDVSYQRYAVCLL
jgi:hypothetical protein